MPNRLGHVDGLHFVDQTKDRMKQDIAPFTERQSETLQSARRKIERVKMALIRSHNRRHRGITVGNDNGQHDAATEWVRCVTSILVAADSLLAHAVAFNEQVTRVSLAQMAATVGQMLSPHWSRSSPPGEDAAITGD